MPRVPFTIDNRFLEEVRDSVLAHARSYCGSWATTDDCEDLVQEAMLAMYKNVRSGRLTVLTSRLSTYVNGILENIAKKQFRERQKIADRMPDAGDGDDFPPVDIAVARDAVDRWHDEDEELEQLQDAVREIVENMNEPCRSILWAYYWDGKNTRTIADEQHYSNARVAITQLSRCRTKVREAMTDIINKLRQ